MCVSSVCMCVCMYVHKHVSVCVYVHVWVCACVYLFIFLLSVCLSVCLSVYLSIYLSVCLSVSLSICLPFYLSVYICVNLNVFVCVCAVPVEWWCGVTVFQSPVVDGDDFIGRLYHLSVDRSLNRFLKEKNKGGEVKTKEERWKQRRRGANKGGEVNKWIREEWIRVEKKRERGERGEERT